HTVAYVLLWHVRQAAAGTQLATASMDTLRLRLLKVGARVKESVRRVVVQCASSYPYKALLLTILANLARLEQQPLPIRV
ncbi:MAG: IS1380 family transposase, partial [Calditrichaeota bacterium]